MILVADLIGIPYKPGGRTKEEGFDCFGLVLEVYRRMNINLPDVVYDNINDAKLVDEYTAILPLVEVSDAEEGIIIEAQTKDSLHVGVCLDGKIFIHATKNQGVRISPVKCIRNRRFFKWVQ